MSKRHISQNRETIAFMVGGKLKTVPRASLQGVAVLRVLLAGGSDAELLAALRPEAAIQAYTGGNGFSVEPDGTIKFRGETVTGGAATKVREFVRDGRDPLPLIKFMARLLANPSRNSRERLYAFLENKNLPITPDGTLLAYKGVREDFWSLTGGTLKMKSGKVDESGHVFNGVGEVIRCERRDVDDNLNNHCSYGLVM